MGTNGTPPIKSTPSDELSEERRERLIRGIAEGELPLHRLPGDLSADEAASIRREALERRTETETDGLDSYSFDAETVSGNNCENLIGTAQVPMGAVGPLPIDGDHVQEEVYVPLATTEGALIASVNRGCAALREAGCATVHVEDVGMTRAPVFRTSGIEETQAFLDWIEEHEEEIRDRVETTSEYLELLELRTHSVGTTVFVRFRFSTGDAMGMNMVTLACDQVIQELITPATGVDCVSLSGNYCVDKKPAAVNAQEGRGKRIFAEVELSESVLREALKTTAADLSEVQYRKNLLGSAAAGSMGMNAHYANMVAAFFVATGQDIAQVSEGAIGVTCIEPRPEDSVYVSIFMPDVPLGAVGGGTGLQTQEDALSLMNVSPDSDDPGTAVMRLTEILGATVLAGELSLMSALSSHHLASAHRELGRQSIPTQNGKSNGNGMPGPTS
jgi:hydroxymethylglutaryl-CoA reductase (NADPH)